MKPASIQLLEILCGSGGNVEALGRAGVRRLDLSPDGGLTLLLGDGIFPSEPIGGVARVTAMPEQGPTAHASAADGPGVAGEEQGSEDDLDTAHLDQ